MDGFNGFQGFHELRIFVICVEILVVNWANKSWRPHWVPEMWFPGLGVYSFVIPQPSAPLPPLSFSIKVMMSCGKELKRIDYSDCPPVVLDLCWSTLTVYISEGILGVLLIFREFRYIYIYKINCWHRYVNFAYSWLSLPFFPLSTPLPYSLELLYRLRVIDSILKVYTDISR